MPHVKIATARNSLS